MIDLANNFAIADADDWWVGENAVATDVGSLS